MPRTVRRIAAAIATTAIAGTALVALASPAGAAAAVSPSKAVGVDPAGETITVTGSGFDSSRGIYLMFCEQVGTSGTPGGRPGGDSCSGAQAWITAPGAGVPPTGTTPWTGEGTFELDVAVSATFGAVDCRAEGTTCGFVTRNDHREPGAYDQDTFTPIAFAADDPVEPTEPSEPEPADPTVTVTPTTGLDAAGTVVAVEGASIPEGQGVYVRFCATPTDPIGSLEGRPAAGTCDGDGLWVTPNPPPGAPLPTIVDGAFSVELPVAGAFAGDEWIDCTTDGACGVFVLRDHNGGATDVALDSFTPLSFDPATDPPVDPAEPTDPEPNATSITATPSTDVVDGQTVTVTGTGFVAGQGVYVQWCATPTGALGTAAGRAASCYPEQDGEHVVWVTPIAAGGTFATPLTVAASFTDASGHEVDCTQPGACGAFVRRDHAGGTSDFSQDAFAPVAFGDGDPVEPPAATLAADRTIDLDPDGDQLTVEGAGYRPGDPVFVALCDATVPNFAACDFEHVVEATPATAGSSSARALGDAGTFSATLDVRAEFGDTDCLAGATCAVQTWSVSGSDVDAEVTLPVAFAARPATATTTIPAGTLSPGGGDAAQTDDAIVGDGTLARTGWSPGPLTSGALALVAAGAGLVVASRQRRRAEA